MPRQATPSASTVAFQLCTFVLLALSTSQLRAQHGQTTLSPTAFEALNTSTRPIDIQALKPYLRGSNLPVSGRSSPRAASNALLILWAFLQQQFPEMQTATFTNTDNKQISALIQFKSAPTQKSITGFFNFVNHHVVTPDPPHTTCPLSDPATNVNCCFESVNTDCLLKEHWEDAPDYGKPLLKAAFTVHTFWLLAKEVAVATRLYSLDQIKAGSLPGNQLLFAWPFYANDAHGQPTKNFVITVVDAAVVDRFALTIAKLTPRLRQATNSTASGYGYGCTPAGLAPAAEPTTGSPTGSVLISQGNSVGITRPTDSSIESYSRLKLSIYALPLAWFGLEQFKAEPVGGPNQSFVAFVAAMKQKTEYFPCMLGSTTEAVRSSRNLLNSGPTSVFFFYTMFFKGVWNEFSSAIGSAATINTATKFDTLSREETDSTAKCVRECITQPSPICLGLTPTDTLRRSLLSTFATFTQTPPFQVTSSQLAALYGISDPSLISLRGPTNVQVRTVSNVGKGARLTAGANGTDVALEVPAIVTGQRSTLSSSSLILLAMSALLNTPMVKFVDPSLNNQYGGAVIGVRADANRTIIATERGCVDVFYGSRQVF